MQLRQAILEVNGITRTLLPGKSNSFEEIYADFQRETDPAGSRYSIFLHPKTDVVIQKLELQFDLPARPGMQFFANGYQSWSESRNLPVEAAIPRLQPFARKYMGHYGDEFIAGIKRGAGNLHAWTYTWISDPTANPPKIYFVGSISERTGFTLIQYDRAAGLLTVKKDLQNLQLSHSFPALDIWTGHGAGPNTEAVCDALANHFFKIAEIEKPAEIRSALGWTSWYRHFTNISEDIILKNLEAVHDSGLPFEWFQIDDGWQQAVGDWLKVKPAFPKGMGKIAAQIRAKGLRPGIWLAPFVVANHSDILRRNPEWLLRDAGGKPLRVGYNPYWGGWFHALDFYNPGVRDYLSGVFHVLTDQWGYELLKLDFLFAACLQAPPGKTRGQVMFEAMEWLRSLAGKAKILACGVPLGAAFGQVDYCRIGGDVHLKWDNPLMDWLQHRERVSTRASLRNTISRRHLHKRAFLNDPDVFILRNEEQALSAQQQNTLLNVNTLLGGLIFTSDDLSTYSPEQLSELQSALDLMGASIQSVHELMPDVFRIDYVKDGRHASLTNLTKKKRSVQIGRDWFELEPFETVTLFDVKA